MVGRNVGEGERFVAAVGVSEDGVVVGGGAYYSPTRTIRINDVGERSAVCV